jgi:hypothetical protein
MEFGLSIVLQNYHDYERHFDVLERGAKIFAPRISDAEIYSSGIRLGKLAELLGFDSIWKVEHHFIPYTIVPDPIRLSSYRPVRLPISAHRRPRFFDCPTRSAHLAITEPDGISRFRSKVRQYIRGCLTAQAPKASCQNDAPRLAFRLSPRRHLEVTRLLAGNRCLGGVLISGEDRAGRSAADYRRSVASTDAA